MITNEVQLKSVGKMLGVESVTVRQITNLHVIVKVKLHPWAWLALGALHRRAYRAAKKAIDDDFSLVEVW